VADYGLAGNQTKSDRVQMYKWDTPFCVRAKVRRYADQINDPCGSRWPVEAWSVYAPRFCCIGVFQVFYFLLSKILFANIDVSRHILYMLEWR
jgi:hypothetical protein